MSVWHLTGGGCSLVLADCGQALPRWVWFGEELPAAAAAAAGTTRRIPGLPAASLEQPVLPSLCPVSGMGWFGLPALSVGGQPVIFAPAVVVVGDRSLTVTARADGLVWQQQIELAETGIVTLRTRLENTGSVPLRLDHCASAAVELPPDASEILTFDGGWTEEFQERHVSLPVGIFRRETTRGRTSHDAFPGVIVSDPQGRQHLAAHLGWSGNHRLSVERLRDGTRLLMLGENLLPGEGDLPPGGVYEAPAAHVWVSADGLDGIRRLAHGHVRAFMGTRRPRPVHLNTWEALYFNHDPAVLADLVVEAAALGVERFVLDDGWFLGRHHDRAALGDWTPDPRKYPQGLGELFSRVQAAGMEVGLWVEPEMVNPDSDLYRRHPDWCLHVPGADRPTARHQLVLDVARPEVADYLFAALDRLLSEYPIAYLKWDMNRDLAPAWGGETGGWRYRAQVLAVYALIDRLKAAHPAVEIESCASGGGRADWEILRRTDRIWTSDSNDARDRAVIQRGFSLFFPPEVMGSHVGPSECHTSGRKLPLTTRIHVALFGHMGIEWDVREATPQQKADLARLIALHKEWRPVLHGGQTVTLPFDPALASGWGVMAGDRGIFCCYRREGGQAPLSLRLSGLEPQALYTLTVLDGLPEGWPAAGQPQSGALLMRQGVLLPLHRPDTTLLFSVGKL